MEQQERKRKNKYSKRENKEERVQFYLTPAAFEVFVLFNIERIYVYIHIERERDREIARFFEVWSW